MIYLIISIFLFFGLTPNFIEQNAEKELKKQFSSKGISAESINTNIKVFPKFKIFTGRVDRVTIKIHRLDFDGLIIDDFIISSRKIKVRPVGFSPKDVKIIRIGKTESVFNILENDINNYLIPKVAREVSDFRMDFKKSKITISFHPQTLILNPKIEIDCEFETNEGTKINLKIPKAKIGFLKIPKVIIDFLVEAINPVIDISEFDFQTIIFSPEGKFDKVLSPKIKEVIIEDDFIRIICEINFISRMNFVVK